MIDELILWGLHIVVPFVLGIFLLLFSKRFPENIKFVVICYGAFVLGLSVTIVVLAEKFGIERAVVRGTGGVVQFGVYIGIATVFLFIAILRTESQSKDD